MAINIAVVSYKGGVAKTTTAVHLAAYIRIVLEKYPLLIDGDLNQSALDWYQIGEHTKKRFPFPVTDEDMFNRLMANPATEKQWNKQYDYFIWDTPARPTEEELADLAKADFFLVPVTPDPLAIRATYKMIDDLKKLQPDSNAKLPMVAIITKCPPKPSTVGTEAAKALQEEEIHVLPCAIPRLTAFEKAALDGCLVQKLPGKYSKAGWAAYVKAFDALDFS